MEIETLYDNEWLSLKQIKEPKDGTYGYVYSHETRCNGNIITMLPYRYIGNKIQYLLRNEITPCWKSNEHVISSITGGLEEDQTIYDCAKNELYEEAGYDVEKNDFRYFGKIYGIKSSDTYYHLFIIDLTNVNKTGDASGDGSEGEANAYCFWSNNVFHAMEPFVYTLYYKIQNEL